VKAFLERGARILAYDPLARESADFELKGRALILDTAQDCLRDADVVVVATPDPEFKALTAADFQREGRTVTVIDFWRILSDRLNGLAGVEYVGYGRGPAESDGGGVLQQLWSQTAAHYGC
jgi:UDP-N-acetyl-D-mannosaminuronate dehydrogenase